MGGPTPSRIPSKSPNCRGFLIALWFLNFIVTSDCRSGPNETHSFRFSTHQWKYRQEEAGRCPSLVEGAKQLAEGVELTLIHIYGSCSPLRPANASWTAIVAEILDRDRDRLQFLGSGVSGGLTASASVPLQPGTKYGGGNYVTTVGFGTPAKNFKIVMDTGSDLTWMQCEPCEECYSQVDPIFSPGGSSSFQVVGCQATECHQLEATGLRRPCTRICRYGLRYRDGSESEGTLSRETLRLGSDSFENFAFGCGHTNTGRFFKGAAGFLGLGQSLLSIPHQTRFKYRGYFSYCVPMYTMLSSVGSLRLGPSAMPPGAVYTRIQPKPDAPSLYFVGLSGISVGGQMLDIPPSAFEQRDGKRGTIIDSGTAATCLVYPAYEALKAAFLEKTTHIGRAPDFGDLDVCYNMTGRTVVDVPIIRLHFSDSAMVVVNLVGTMIILRRDLSQVCLAFRSSADTLNIIGSFQQQGYRVSYDIPNARIGFAPESCSSP